MPLVLGGDRRKIVSRWKKGGVPVDNPYGHLLLEDGDEILLEDGGYILLEFDNVRLENGDNLLLEDGNLILWEA
jgi:hypothetical protein